MDKEKIKEILYGEQLRKEQDEEFARRLDSKNMFIKNAGPREPDWRMAQKVIEILKRNQAHAQKIEDKKRDHQRRIDELDSIIGKTIPSIECSVFNPSQHPYQPVPVNPESSSLPETRQDIFAKSPDKHQTSMPAPGVPAVLPGRGTSLEKRTAEPMPYLRGEDINSDYSSFLQANVIAGKPSQPVLLEDSTFYFALRAYASGDSVMLKGPSRSGKSLLADRISMLTDHVIIGGASNNALLDHIEDINSIGKVYITEHQSVVDPNPRIKEIIKHILEGKDYIFHSNGLVKELKGTTQILTTAADENKHIQKIDVELYSRYTPFRTGLTPEKIRDISDYMDGLLDGTIDDVIFSQQSLEKVRTHFDLVRNHESASSINPFIKSYAPHLPETQKSLHSRSIYLGLINASTRFDSINRIAEQGKLVTNLSDLYLVHTYKYDEYCENLQLLTAQTFYSHRNNPNEIEKKRHEETREYELNLIEEVRYRPVDWEFIWRSGYSIMRDHHPSQLKEWIDLHTKEGIVTIYDPISRTQIDICRAEAHDA